MPAERQRFECFAGDAFTRDFEWERDGVDVDLSDYTWSMEFRRREDASSSLLTLTLGSGLTLSGDNFTLTWLVTSAQMATMFTAASGVAGEDLVVVFDLVAIASSNSDTKLPGILHIWGDADR